MKNAPHMFSWMNPKLEVRETANCGRGIFTKKLLRKKELLAVFGGYVMTLEAESKLPEGFQDLAHQISENLVIGINDPKDTGPSDLFNHSCNPNAGFKGQIFLMAMRSIKKDEQVTFDYAMTLGGKTKYTLSCACGSSICRGKITNNDWKKPILQKKYRGYFQWYLEELIEKRK